jgi:voltage-gated potassium channel
MLFALEYAARIWCAADDPAEDRPGRARIRYVLSVPGLVDFISAIPFALSPHLGVSIDWLDIVPIFKLLRYTAAFQFLVEAVYSERRVLASAAVLLLALLVFQSSILYYLEREVQPDKFASIPDAMWWGIITLATVGYGDVTPVTALGKVAGGITAILGLCMFAIPIGIIASAFIEAARRREFVVTWNLVANVPMFRHLDAARIAALAGVLGAQRVERGERIIHKGECGESMYFVVSGEVEVDAGAGAKTFRLSSGDFFGEIALIEDLPRTATVSAQGPVRLLVLHKRDFDRFMAGHPELAQSVRLAAEQRLRDSG